MLLQKVKIFVKQRHVVSLFDLKREFTVDPDVLRDMLGFWIQKGQVRSLKKADACGSRCNKCDPLFTELYEWVSIDQAKPEAVIHATGAAARIFCNSQ